MLKPATLTVSPALAEEDDLEAEELPEVGEELVPASPSQPVHESGSTESAALEIREAAGTPPRPTSATKPAGSSAADAAADAPVATPTRGTPGAQHHTAERVARARASNRARSSGAPITQ